MNELEKEDGRRVVARTLREVRAAHGMSIEEAGRAISVEVRHLEVLEHGNFEALPSPLWARWILIRYANHLDLEGERLADEHLPLQRVSSLKSPSRPAHRLRRHLKRHRWALLASLGAIAFEATVTLATVVAPYSALTGWVGGFLHGVAPEIFLGSGPQRVIVLGNTESGATGGDNILMAKIAEDDLGLLSLPRNTLTEIPGHGRGEIGDAFALGGPDLARQSVARLTDTEVPNYCVVGAVGIRNIVDSMDGVRVDLPQPVRGRVASGEPEVALRAGPQTLDGDQALVYLQGNDLPDDAQRADRQQNFLYAMFRQALGPSNLLAHPSTLGTVLENTETNMSGVQLAQLIGRARALKGTGAPIETGAVPGQQERASGSREGAPAYYWVPDTQRLPDVLEATVR